MAKYFLLVLTYWYLKSFSTWKSLRLSHMYLATLSLMSIGTYVFSQTYTYTHVFSHKHPYIGVLSISRKRPKTSTYSSLFTYDLPPIT